MRKIRKIVLLSLVVCPYLDLFSSTLSQKDEVVWAVSDDGRAIYQKILSGIDIGFGRHVSSTQLGEHVFSESLPTIAIGPKSSLALGDQMKGPWVSIFGSEQKYRYPPAVKVDLQVPVVQELVLLKYLLKEGGGVGVFYHPVRSRNAFLAASIMARQNGVHLVGMQVYSERDIRTNLDDHQTKFKTIWLMNDPVVYRAEFLSALTKQSKERRIAVVGGGSNIAARGALASLSVNFIDTGNQIGKWLKKESFHLNKHRHLSAELQLNFNINVADLTFPEASARLQRYAKEQNMRFALQ